jgi:nicotinamide riboside transporter PnuC
MLCIISAFTGIINNYTSALLFIIVLCLYFYSGYISTNIKSRWYNYFGIALIGAFLWIIAFTESPDSLNYKSDPEAGAWMFYRFYIAGIETPLNFIGFLNFADSHSPRLEMYYIFIVPLLASIMQYLGGFYKGRLLKKIGYLDN